MPRIKFSRRRSFYYSSLSCHKILLMALHATGPYGVLADGSLFVAASAPSSFTRQIMYDPSLCDVIICEPDGCQVALSSCCEATKVYPI